MREGIAESGGVTNVKKAANQFRSSGEMSRVNMRRGFTTRQVGLALAAGTAIASIAIVATLVLRSPTKRSAVVSPAAPSVPDVREMPTGDAPTLGSGDQFFIQFVDRSDPTRLGGEITATRSTPQPDGRYDLTQPIGWFFLDDGRSVQVMAAEGTIVMPAGARSSSPDRGSLEGDVRVRMFGRTTDGKRPGADAQPVATLRTPRLTIDWTLGQLDMPDAVAIASDVLTFDGRGVIVQFDAMTKRLESLYVAKTERAIYDPAAQAATVPRRAVSDASQETDVGSRSVAQDGAGASEKAVGGEVGARLLGETAKVENAVEPLVTSLDLADQTMYAISMEGAVRLRQAGQVVTGDRLEGWARTVDNRLPDRTQLRVKRGAGGEAASGDVVAGEKSAADAVVRSSALATESPRSSSVAAAEREPTATSIELQFTGPLDVRRVADAPPQLERDDLLMRVLAEGDADATLSAAKQGVRVTGRELEYAATRRTVSLNSPAPAMAQLVAERGEENVAVSGHRIEASLSRGVARVLSEGSIEQSKAGVRQARLAWSDEAQFDLVPPDEPTGLPRGRLLAANMLGNVRGELEQGMLSADSVSASFAKVGEIAGDASPLQMLRLVGKAKLASGVAKEDVAKDDVADAVEASTIAISFDAFAKDITPTQVVAQGDVRGTSSGATLESQSATVELARNDAGKVETRQLDASGGVKVTTADGIVAAASELLARPVEQRAKLTGTPARLTQSQSELAAPVIELDGVAKSILATGVGELRSIENAGDGAAKRDVRASWRESFAFNDVSGLAKLAGDANVEMLQGPTSRDTTSAATIEMLLAEREQRSGDGDARPADASARSGVAGSFVSPGGDRNVLWILATGTPAKVRSERFDASDSTVRTRMISLSSPTIRADVPQQMVRASGAGQLVTSEAANVNAGNRETFSATNVNGGQSVFAWRGYADFEQAIGVATMHDNVRMIYRASEAEQPTELETQTLRAVFEQMQGRAEVASAQVRSVTASGGVWARSQGRELTAATLSYDPANSIFDAQGAGSVLVDVAGTASDPPLSAKQVRWDLKRNRVEVVEPAPTVVPR
jgi:hypothetical protein